MKLEEVIYAAFSTFSLLQQKSRNNKKRVSFTKMILEPFSTNYEKSTVYCPFFAFLSLLASVFAPIQSQKYLSSSDSQVTNINYSITGKGFFYYDETVNLSLPFYLANFASDANWVHRGLTYPLSFLGPL